MYRIIFKIKSLILFFLTPILGYFPFDFYRLLSLFFFFVFFFFVIMATQTRTETFWKINLNLKNARPWHWAQLSPSPDPALQPLCLPLHSPGSHLTWTRAGIPRLDEPLPACCLCLRFEAVICVACVSNWRFISLPLNPQSLVLSFFFFSFQSSVQCACVLIVSAEECDGKYVNY